MWVVRADDHFLRVLLYVFDDLVQDSHLAAGKLLYFHDIFQLPFAELALFH